MANVSKARIAEAKKLAKQYRVDVAGWNAKPGKEFITCTGSPEKLAKLEEVLKTRGWNIWPQSPETEGWMLDCSLYPAPEKPMESGLGIEEVEQEEPKGPPVDHYRYCGPSSIFFPNAYFAMTAFGVYVFILLSTLGYIDIQTMELPEHLKNLGIFSVFFGLTLIVILACCISVSADTKQLTVRSNLLRRKYSIPYDNIKRVKMIKEKGEKGVLFDDTYYLGIDRKEGKHIDIFLPRRKQPALMKLIKDNL